MKKKMTILVTLVTLVCLKIFAINKLIARFASMSGLLNDFGGNYYSWRFGRLFYKKSGKGSPVLLIHDLNPLASGREWEGIASKLSENHTVYVLDLLGCGRSEKPELTYTNFFYVQMITDFIDAIIGEKTDIIASKSSSTSVIMACCNEHATINKVILVNPCSLTSLAKAPSTRSKILMGIIRLPLIGTLLYNILFCKNNIRKTIAEDLHVSKQDVSESYLTTCYEASHIGHFGGKFLFSSIIGNYLNANLYHCLKNINQSIYIITGTDEYKANASQYQELCPSIEIISSAQPTKSPHFTSVEDTLSLINIFLDEQ